MPAALSASTFENRLAWVSGTALGVPVVPEVKSRTAMSWGWAAPKTEAASSAVGNSRSRAIASTPGGRRGHRAAVVTTRRQRAVSSMRPNSSSSICASTGIAVAPVATMAQKATIQAGLLGAVMATVAPGPMPRAASARPKLPADAASAARLVVSIASPENATTAGASPFSARRRSRVCNVSRWAKVSRSPILR